MQYELHVLQSDRPNPNGTVHAQRRYNSFNENQFDSIIIGI